MLIPKKVKHRKWMKGRSLGRMVETRGTSLAFGSFGLKAESAAWLNSKQIEAGRRSLTNFLKRQGKVFIRVFPDKPITKQAPEKTLGGGKGAVDHYVFPVKPGRIIFEVDGVTREIAREALRITGFKMPMRTRIVEKEQK